MKNKIVYNALMLIILVSVKAFAQTTGEPWTAAQLVETKDLAAVISDPSKPQPLIICIGPQAVIKGSVDVGPGGEKENIKKLEKTLAKVDKNKEVVLYCGCCPFAKCPNIRPAFSMLKEKGFTKARLLNVTQNIKTNWIDPGYPVIE